MNNTDNHRQNFYAFIWHALFLAFAATFIDVNTVLTSFILKIGGNTIHVGLLTGIYIGLPMITQILFAGFLSGRSRKKPFLLLGIYLRVLALAGMGHTLLISNNAESGRLMSMIFLWIALFAVSGAFAGISYTDLMGKIFIGIQREKLLIFRQIVSGTGMLISAIAARHLVSAFSYPKNYTIIFFTASAILFIAAFGFLMIKEESGGTNNIHSMTQIIRSIPEMLRSDKNLINYILLINFTSFGITIIPFYVALSKSTYGLTQYQIGNFLLLQFVGMIVSSVIWNWIAKYYKYKGIFFGCIVTGSLLPVTALFLSRYDVSIFQWIFFISGFSISAYTIALQGILLEITNNDNRAIYTGICGTLSLAAAIFPLIAGALIRVCGFNVVFTMISLLILGALLFLKQIKCSDV